MLSRRTYPGSIGVLSMTRSGGPLTPHSREGWGERSTVITSSVLYLVVGRLVAAFLVARNTCCLKTVSSHAKTVELHIENAQLVFLLESTALWVTWD